MSKRLLIDLDRCDSCEKCSVKCDYFYRAGAEEHGVLTLREYATFMLVCRRCEDAGCVAACRFDALERRDDGVLKRHNMRCMSCKSCSHACPFGTIYPDTLPFYTTQCDFCLAKGAEPACVISCENKALEYADIEESEKDGVYLLNDNLAVRGPKWDKKNV